MIQFAKRFAAHESGATAIEYAVLIVFLSSGIVAALSIFQESLYGIINTAAEEIVAAIS